MEEELVQPKQVRLLECVVELHHQSFLVLRLLWKIRHESYPGNARQPLLHREPRRCLLLDLVKLRQAELLLLLLLVHAQYWTMQ